MEWALLMLLAVPETRRKEDVVREYEHEVQGGTVVGSRLWDQLAVDLVTQLSRCRWRRCEAQRSTTTAPWLVHRRHLTSARIDHFPDLTTQPAASRSASSPILSTRAIDPTLWPGCGRRGHAQLGGPGADLNHISTARQPPVGSQPEPARPVE